MKGSRNRTAWGCRLCRYKFYKRKAWTSHMWAKHQVAVIRKVRFYKEDQCKPLNKPREPVGPSTIRQERSMKSNALNAGCHSFTE